MGKGEKGLGISILENLSEFSLGNLYNLVFCHLDALYNTRVTSYAVFSHLWVS